MNGAARTLAEHYWVASLKLVYDAVRRFSAETGKPVGHVHVPEQIHADILEGSRKGHDLALPEVQKLLKALQGLRIDPCAGATRARHVRVQDVMGCVERVYVFDSLFMGKGVFLSKIMPEKGDGA